MITHLNVNINACYPRLKLSAYMFPSFHFPLSSFPSFITYHETNMEKKVIIISKSHTVEILLQKRQLDMKRWRTDPHKGKIYMKILMCI